MIKLDDNIHVGLEKIASRFGVRRAIKGMMSKSMPAEKAQASIIKFKKPGVPQQLQAGSVGGANMTGGRSRLLLNQPRLQGAQARPASAGLRLGPAPSMSPQAGQIKFSKNPVTGALTKKMPSKFALSGKKMRLKLN